MRARLHRAWVAEPDWGRVSGGITTWWLGFLFLFATACLAGPQDVGPNYTTPPEQLQREQAARDYDRALDAEKQAIAKARAGHVCVEVTEPGTVAWQGVIAQSSVATARWRYLPLDAVWRAQEAGEWPTAHGWVIRQWCTS